MAPFDFDSQSVWLNGLVFAVASVLVWGAGTRLTGYLDGIAGRTGVGHAFLGLLFLGGVTSLPEVASVGTAAWTGNAAIATNNLLGSVSINILLLAFADVLMRRRTITSSVTSSDTLLHATLNILVLGILCIAILTGDRPFAGAGLWTTLLLILCVAGFWLASGYPARTRWRVVADNEPAPDPQSKPHPPGRQHGREQPDGHSLSGLILRCVVAGSVILLAGYLLARSADAIATATGIGSGLIGLVLVAFATSLPELSSITEAVRRQQYEMAMGDVFGTNLLTIALIFLADMLYGAGPVVNEAGRFEAIAALLGIVLTAIFAIGLLERSTRTRLRMGYDTLTMVLVFAGGMLILYFNQS